MKSLPNNNNQTCTIVILFALVTSACQVPYDPDNMQLNDAGTVDFTKYSGLTIYGELDDGNEVTKGPLDLGKLQAALFTSCWDDVINNGDDPNLTTSCPEYLLYTEDLSDKEKCIQHVCLQQAYICLGYRNLEIAESNGIYELKTSIYDYYAILEPKTGIIYFDINPPDGDFTTGEPPSGPAPRVLNAKGIAEFNYRIPPLTSNNKTLPLLAAYAAFREAGIESGQAVDVPACIQTLAEKHATKSSLPSLMDHYTFGFAEATNKLGEAVGLLTDNEVNVGTSATATNTRTEAQFQQWEGLANSRKSALTRILGAGAGAAPATLKDLVVGCSTPCAEDTTQAAIAFLRESALADIFNSNITEQALVQAAIDQKYIPSENPLPAPTVEDYLNQHGFTLGDVAIARQYLQDEQKAFARIRTEDNGKLLGGIAKPTFQHPGAYYIGKLSGSTGLSVQADGPDYARVGAIQAVDYFRTQTNKILSATLNNAALKADAPPITEDHKRVLSSVSILGQKLAGSRRVDIDFNENDDGNRAVYVRVHGVAEGERVLLVKNKEGYRCVAEGTIDGNECDFSSYVVAQDANRLLDNASDYIDPMDPYIEIELPSNLSNPSEADQSETDVDEDIFVFLANVKGRSRPALLGSFRKPTSKIAFVPGITTIPAFGVYTDIVPTSYVNHDTQCCNDAENMCGDLNLRRGTIPPLENELTEDSDPYENSWRHYLDLAEKAALEADQLGEDMVRYGLEMDLRAEQKVTELEDLCGVEITSLPDFPTGQSCDPSDSECTVIEDFIADNPELAHCLSIDGGGAMEREDYSTLGSTPVCIYKWKKTGRVCSCTEAEEEQNRCSRQCPLVVPDHLIPRDPNDDQIKLPITAQTCEDAYEEITGLSLADFNVDTGTGDSETADFIPVNTKLSVFQNHGNELLGFDCQKVRDFGTYVSANTNAPKSVLEDMYNDLMSSQSWWINPQYLTTLAQGLEVDTDFFYHYSVRLGGKILWTTKVSNASDCPAALPWLATDNTYNTNPTIQCYHPTPTGTDPGVWATWLQEEFVSPGYAKQRRTWGLRMQRYLLMLGALTGKVNNVIVARSRNGSGQIPIVGESYTNLKVRENTEADLCEAEPCVCWVDQYGSVEDVPNIESYFLDEADIINCDSNKLRYDCRINMTVEDSARSALYDFWNLDLFNMMTYWRFSQDLHYRELWSLKGSGGSSCGLGDTITVDRIDCSSVEGIPGVWAACAAVDFLFDHEQRFDVLQVYTGGGQFLSLLDFSCNVASKRLEACENMDLDAVPEINRVEDLDGLRSYVVCAANTVHKHSGAIVLPGLPNTLIEGLNRSGFEGQYPGLSGEVLDIVIGIETALREFSNASDSVRELLVQVADNLLTVRLAVESIGVKKKLSELRTLRNVVASAANAISGAASSRGASLANLATIPIDIEIGDMEQVLLNLEEEQTLHSAVSNIYTALIKLRETLKTVGDTYGRIQSGLSKLDRAQSKASRYIADINFLDSDAAGSARAVNTVMRRRQNTLRARYQTAALRARKLAFLARRAIEFRLGVDLNELDHDMTLVPKPSSWADRVCTMQGFDYERLRNGDEDLFDPDDPIWDLDPEYQPQDDYRYWYIGDYVKLLRDFVESYNIDFPFTDENDIAVISVREDYLKVKQQCLSESRNRLYYTDAPGTGYPIYDDYNNKIGYHGWKQKGCVVDSYGVADRCLDVVVPDPDSAAGCNIIDDFCFGEDPNLYDPNDPSNLPPGKATRLRDREYDSNRPIINTMPMNSGYLSQIVEGNPEGDYVLTWYNRLPDTAISVDYRVEVWEVGDSTGIVIGDHFTPDATFVRQELRFSLQTTTNIEVRFYPSNDTDNPQSAGASFGDVWIWGTQLERLDPWRCRNDEASCSTLPALSYKEVDGDRENQEVECTDYDGSKLRERFKRECICPEYSGGQCPANAAEDSKKCYWYLPMEFPLIELENGSLIPSNNIAARNINYRIDEVAVNLVGTNVRNCAYSSSPSTCATNAFIPYSLDHYGVAQVSAYESEVSYTLPTARIEHGKALAAEIVVTNPLTSNHSQLLGSYFKTGLRGRPLTGSYMLRIWETPELDWRRVEDIQLVFRYRYWTRSDRQF